MKDGGVIFAEIIKIYINFQKITLKLYYTGIQRYPIGIVIEVWNKVGEKREKEMDTLISQSKIKSGVPGTPDLCFYDSNCTTDKNMAGTFYPKLRTILMIEIYPKFVNRSHKSSQMSTWSRCWRRSASENWN